MAQKGDTQINTFVGGLITEASPLLFPESASFDEINFKLLKDGTRERRLGLNYEDNAQLNPGSLTVSQLPVAKQKFFRWETPGGSNKVEIGIVQLGNILWFIDLFSSAPSSVILNNGNSITLPIAALTSVFDFTVVNDDVIIVSDELASPYTLVYDEDSDVVTASTLTLKIRDTYGVDDALAADERPASLTAQHEYNLRNQGWSANIETTCTSIEDAILCTKDVLLVHPSNSDTWSLGKIEDVSDADVDKFDPDTLKRNSVDLGLAAKGHYIINLYDRGSSRSTVSGLVLPNQDRELGRISTVATYSGRAFYSGIRSKLVGSDSVSPKLSGSVFFSQIVRSPSDYVKCYQDADPTSVEVSDIVATDGGIIPVLGATNILKLLTVKQSLFVFAQNGVWEIKGDEGGFKATEFQVSRITTVGAISRDSIIETNGSVLYWANEGIFSLAPDQFGSSWDATNLTLATIQTLYDDIPNVIKESVRGYYDQGHNQVRWLYQSDTPKIVGYPVDPPVVPVQQLGAAANLDIVSTAIDITSLSDTKAIVSFTVSNVLYAVVVNIDGVSLTLGAPVSLTETAFSTSVVRLTNNTCVVAYHSTGNIAKAAVLTVTGDLIAIGTPITYATVSVTPSVKIEPSSSTRVVSSYINSASTDNSAQALDISGTTITAKTAKNISTTLGHTYTNLTMLSAGRGVVTSFSSGYIKGVIIDISALGSITNGIEYNVSQAGATTNETTMPAKLASNTLMSTHRHSGGVLINNKLTIFGTAITLSSTNSLNNVASKFSTVNVGINTQVVTYSTQSGILPKVNINNLGIVPVEGTPLSLHDTEQSFENASFAMSSNKAIMVYKNFSGYLRVFALTTG